MEVLEVGKTQALQGSNLAPNTQHTFSINGNFRDDDIILCQLNLSGADARNTFERASISQGNAYINFIYTGSQFGNTVWISYYYMVVRPT